MNTLSVNFKILDVFYNYNVYVRYVIIQLKDLEIPMSFINHFINQILNILLNEQNFVKKKQFTFIYLYSSKTDEQFYFTVIYLIIYIHH